MRDGTRICAVQCVPPDCSPKGSGIIRHAAPFLSEYRQERNFHVPLVEFSVDTLANLSNLKCGRRRICLQATGSERRSQRTGCLCETKDSTEWTESMVMVEIKKKSFETQSSLEWVEAFGTGSSPICWKFKCCVITYSRRIGFIRLIIWKQICCVTYITTFYLLKYTVIQTIQRWKAT